MGQRDGWLGEVGRALNAALRWFGRVVGAGAVAGVLHTIVFGLLAFVIALPTGDVEGFHVAGILFIAVLYGTPAGAAAAVLAGLLTAPIMASRRLARDPRARLAVVGGPATLWFVISGWIARSTLDGGIGETLSIFYFLHLGPAAWMAAGLHLAARRFDPGLPRRPASRARADDGDRPLWSWAK